MMHVEHELRWLLPRMPRLGGEHTSRRIIQGYIRDSSPVVRVRLSGRNGARPDSGTLTIKGPRREGRNLELDLPISVEDGEALMDMVAGMHIQKIRHIITFDEHVFELDQFEGSLRGLVILECEINVRSEDETQTLEAVRKIAAKQFLTEGGIEITESDEFTNSEIAGRPPGATLLIARAMLNNAEGIEG